MKESISKIIYKGWEYTIIKMRIDMKESFMRIRNMEKEFITTVKITMKDIKDNGRETKSMDQG